jgi:hypothetical protein
VYAPKGSKSINTILLSRIILFLFLLIFSVVLVVFVALSRKTSGLTLRDKVHNFTRTQGEGFSEAICDKLLSIFAIFGFRLLRQLCPRYHIVVQLDHTLIL